MKGKIYSADYMHSTLATFENGYVYKDSFNFWENNSVLGHYDTNETGTRNIYAGSSTWSSTRIGTIQNGYAHICQSPNRFDLDTDGNYICDKYKRPVAKFEGNPTDALCACVICIHSGLITLDTLNTPAQTTESLATSSSSSSISSSNTTSNDDAGGTGCLSMLLAIILGIAVIAFIICLAIDSISFFWGDLLIKSIQEINLPYFIFYFFPLIASYIGSFALTYKNAKSSKFTEVVTDVISTLFASVSIVGIIGVIATIVDICAQDTSKLYIILVVFFLVPVYWIVSMIPAIIVSLATWIAVKIKFA